MPTKRKDGRLQTSVTVENPITGEKKKVYVYGYDLSELEAEKCRIQNASIEEFLNVSTFHSWCDEFLRIKREDEKLEESTLYSYKLQINKHLLSKIPPSTPIAKITPAWCRQILRGIPGERARLGVYVLLKSIFEEAIVNQLLADNPMRFIKKPKYSTPARSIVTPEIYQMVMDDVSGTQYEYVYKFAWDTGMRRGEICAVRLSHIDLDNLYVHVQKGRKRGENGEYEGAPKSDNGVRDLKISEAAAANIATWIKILRRILFKAGLPWEDDGYLFRSERDLSKPLPLSSITHKFSDQKEHLNLPANVSFHSFRHTHATIMAEQNLSPKQIQLRMGHYSAAFSYDTYVHATNKLQEGIVSAFDKAAKDYGR